MTPSTDPFAAASPAPGGASAATWLQDGAPLAGHDIPAWRNRVALSEDVLLRQQWVSYSHLRPLMPGAVADDVGFLDLPLERYPRGASLAIFIYNPETGNLLRRFALTNEPAQARRGRLYARPWLDAGLRQVAVDIECRPVRGPLTRDHLLLPLHNPAP